MSICESCIRNKDCKWNKGNPRHCTLYTDKKETNFDKITESPEALAEFICQAIFQYDGRYSSFQQDIEDEYCYERNHYEYGDREQVILDWLKEKHHEMSTVSRNREND